MQEMTSGLESVTYFTLFSTSCECAVLVRNLHFHLRLIGAYLEKYNNVKVQIEYFPNICTIP